MFNKKSFRVPIASDFFGSFVGPAGLCLGLMLDWVAQTTHREPIELEC